MNLPYRSVEKRGCCIRKFRIHYECLRWCSENSTGYKKHHFYKTKSGAGFTLLEILLVVAAIAILAGIVILAINPGKQLGDTRNAQRKVDVNTILNATYQYLIDNGGVFPPGITTALTQICVGNIATTTCTGATPSMTTLNELIWGEKYLTALPIDPQATTTNGIGYYISKSDNGRITVKALGAEQGATISVTR